MYNTDLSVLFTSYNTNLDGNRIQDFNVDVAENLHWLVNKENLRGSCILDSRMYNETFTHVENFCNKPICEIDLTQQQGLSLDTDRIYSFNCNIKVAAAYKAYMFFVTSRTLVIQGNNIALI